VCFQSRLATETALVVGWDPAEGYHSIVHSRQKEPAERADLRLRVREKGGRGRGGDFSRGRVYPGFAGGFWGMERVREERGNRGPFFERKKKKTKVESDLCV